VPFCTKCGTKVESNAQYCRSCGAPQPRATVEFSDFLEGISDRTASILCYIPVFGVIPAIIFLASQRFRSNIRVRFNAFQALYLFVTWLIVTSAAPAIMFGFHTWGIQHVFLGMIKFALFICWVYLLVKAAHEEQVRLPIIGDLAARSTTEQL
jgi:uncharacterized membrane protein